MKKCLICFLFIFCLCTGCSKTPPPEPTPQAPVYDQAPTKTETNVVLDGITFDSYIKDDIEYISLTALTKAKSGNINTEFDSADPYSCTFSLDGKLYSLRTDSENISTEDKDTPMGAKPIYDGMEWYLPYGKFVEGMHKFTVDDLTYFTDYPTEFTEGKRLPILMYHAVGDDPWGIASLFVRPSELEKQLQYLKDNGYTTVTFEDADRLDEIEKPVMLTFDDGYEDNYSLLFPLLQKYNAKATVFVITGEIGKTHYLTEKQIKEMSDSGLVSIQSHTVTHPFLSDLGEEQLQEELLGSKKTLTRITGKEPFVICYPTGKHSALSRQVAEEHYKFGLLMNGGTYTTGGDNFLITRSYISRSTSIYDYPSYL